MSFALIVAFLIRTGPDTGAVEVTFSPARYYTTYDECMRDSQHRVDEELKVHPITSNVVLRYACVPVTDSK